tara:strand:+ start:5351 stop:6079 length:729 start_codon:yes stop_codon:yes gene_type:complete
MKKNVEIISLIFKSLDYLEMICEELKGGKCRSREWDIGVRVVCNDASKSVLDKIKDLDIKYTIYNDPNPDDYYLNRVYRCWNFAGRTSEYDNICFVNSDMVFSDGWIDNLLKHYDGTNIPTSRLVESGKMRSGTHGVSYNCGRDPKEINYKLWDKVVGELRSDEVKKGGLYMPCIFEKKRFLESGMYPEGNIYHDGVGTLGFFIKSGDAYYFHDILEKKYNMNHITVFDSLVYHIQEGEKDA